uniref:Flavodoxin-like domain-containing protein n=2 Tax=Pseudo-nitzschia australis TaxID=44445 RepID=A0A7S4AE90_9STRA|mmetsp:Transcript_8703/g.18812  ORF Transcript_8703/g.18812 Transcript_8703/m.18812 type:complete len:297 (+) Transcript_8703:279-1169(+)|eukprot:CAMPEP_0168167154 /NCGR_PEP_ID=MMETSP0139_2-20121125/2403_1 /TAXON_ID=44445 /ORGANISM="Pseudo-nitzschia australis, Strain 10249 10 AB" /LENGTH=296 /DNA_ID=CAMNT_0008084387 /DNA_START=197 /DNA_END=1087 /DNA_ORIENTATION=+
MRIEFFISLFIAAANPSVEAFVVPRQHGLSSSLSLDMASVGIFYGTSTGSTEDVADQIKEAFGDDADGPFDVDDLEGSVQENFEKYDAIVCGTPTWNTGADTERSGTGWDEIYYTSMSELNIEGKHVAVFGLGDQSSYAENFADATGELHDVFQNLGAKMFGYTSMEGYEHEDSKSIRGDKFCGLLCDAVNQDELSGERVQNWVEQLKVENFLEGSSSIKVTTEDTIPESVENNVESVFQDIDECSDMLDETIKQHSETNTGFKSFYNEKTRSTMFVSSDGRSCYYTSDSAGRISP